MIKKSFSNNTYVIVEHRIRFQPWMSFVSIRPRLTIGPSVFKFSVGPRIMIVLRKFLNNRIKIVIENNAKDQTENIKV